LIPVLGNVPQLAVPDRVVFTAITARSTSIDSRRHWQVVGRVNISNRYMNACVLLVKALGGGWRIDGIGRTQSSAGATAMLGLH
jgi:hypothetical protein